MTCVFPRCSKHLAGRNAILFRNSRGLHRADRQCPLASASTRPRNRSQRRYRRGRAGRTSTPTGATPMAIAWWRSLGRSVARSSAPKGPPRLSPNSIPRASPRCAPSCPALPIAAKSPDKQGRILGLDLQCRLGRHPFEGWFGSSQDYAQPAGTRAGGLSRTRLRRRHQGADGAQPSAARATSWRQYRRFPRSRIPRRQMPRRPRLRPLRRNPWPRGQCRPRRSS